MKTKKGRVKFETPRRLTVEESLQRTKDVWRRIREKEAELSLNMGYNTGPRSSRLLDELSTLKEYDLRHAQESLIVAQERSLQASTAQRSGALLGAKSTHIRAIEKADEIRRVYADIVAQHTGLQRWWYIEQTVTHFQGKRKNPRRGYGETTVETATKGLLKNALKG